MFKTITVKKKVIIIRNILAFLPKNAREVLKYFSRASYKIFLQRFDFNHKQNYKFIIPTYQHPEKRKMVRWFVCWPENVQNVFNIKTNKKYITAMTKLKTTKQLKKGTRHEHLAWEKIIKR